MFATSKAGRTWRVAQTMDSSRAEEQAARKLGAQPNGDEGGLVSSTKLCSCRGGCINTLLGAWAVKREISVSSQEYVQGGILEPGL